MSLTSPFKVSTLFLFTFLLQKIPTTGQQVPDKKTTDSAKIITEFKKYQEGYPVSINQMQKIYVLKKTVGNDSSERVKKNDELLKIIKNIDDNGWDKVRSDTSNIVQYNAGPKEKGIFIIGVNDQVNFRNIEREKGLSIKKSYPNFYAAAKSEKVLVYDADSWNDPFEFKLPEEILADTVRRGRGTGLGLPQLYSPGISLTPTDPYKELADRFFNDIVSLVKVCEFIPEIPEWYLKEENPSDSWNKKAYLRKQFIDFLKHKCSIK